jgi:hypothetical protein
MLDKRKSDELFQDQKQAFQCNEEDCGINKKLLLLIDKKIKDWFQSNLHDNYIF